MINILIIGYYNLDDGFLYGAKALNNFNYNINFFPYSFYINDNKPEIDNILKLKIINHKINICLWWNNSIEYNSIKNIVNDIDLNNIDFKNIKHVCFNWDPFLYNYKKYDNLNITKSWEDIINNKIKCYSLMNHIFSCFEREIEVIKNIKYNKKHPSVSYLPPGFDKDISYFYKDELYDCDISIICTNLYDDLKTFDDLSTNITRYEIVNKLYENRHMYKFHIYGPNKFQEKFPDCYKGFIKYKDCYKVFSNSKINLSIHPMIYELNNEKSYEEYFSERVPQILGCKGLLITNSYFSDKLKNNIDYINIDKNIDWFQKILNIIENSELYDEVREHGYKTACKYYEWNQWAKKIDDKIKELENSTVHSKAFLDADPLDLSNVVVEDDFKNLKN